MRCSASSRSRACATACAVVGEDLGTVPDGFRERMQSGARALVARSLLRTRLRTASFVAAERLSAPRRCERRHARSSDAGWVVDGRSQRARASRTSIDCDSSTRLERAGCIDAAGAARLREDAARRRHARRGGGARRRGLHRFLARTPSMLAVVAIEDVLGETGAVNVPGTFDEHPNWRRKRSLSLEEHRSRRTSFADRYVDW